MIGPKLAVALACPSTGELMNTSFHGTSGTKVHVNVMLLLNWVLGGKMPDAAVVAAALTVTE